MSHPPRAGVLPAVWPDRSTFRSLALRHNLIPLCRMELADTETPVSTLLHLGEHPRTFLLESAEGNERVGRHSFLGAGGEAWLEARGPGLFLCREDGEEILHEGDPLDGVRAWLRRFSPAPVPGLPPFAGGLVGRFAYDLVRRWEPVGARRESDLPELRLLVVDRLLAFDHLRHTLQGVVHLHLRPGEDPNARYRDGVDALEELFAQARGQVPAAAAGEPPHSGASPRAAAAPVRPGGHAPVASGLPDGWRPNVSRGAFEEAVRQAKEAIAAGEAFQIVLSQAFRRPVGVPPLAVYRVLRHLNPSPYLFYLRMGEESLCGSSPEMMARLQGERAELRPIAGTRPRGGTEAEDLRFERELRADAKERAEHAMLVDLGRNDLGRVARFGSVRVDRLMTVERFSHVMHLVSYLSARMRPGLDALDLLRATFPAGTVSGAPKVRAMQIIDGLEPEPRGAYAGAVGYLDFAGNMDSCITIRTLHVRRGQATVQAGAGIVADSDPAREYQESVNKARALFEAVARAERGGELG
ncbi:anthranilate synthase component I family protein [Limnochorda pilosa]|uniref:Anthranilate synthase subunit I n=1 Tax=Limnochorda pilosa TaxID=1555112 RepID=A0A0K2SL64_LIMPI|nr:anthranilate synthase component I family protein [Limnochorda pilosa]BAS27584.1 anthranilate synthase subunit I [Limnochorda pilosa]